MYFVYLLLCKDRTIYTGIAIDLDKRLIQHKKGLASRYTRAHKAVRFIYNEKYPNRGEALKRELQIKGWPRKEKLNLVKFGKLPV
ncbi:MAG: GIY-YIG nuclease family protein [Candidatus Yanofskybacteria bacterium]|nr:GIY-YIG nuclease family protein [Candidatus Yanofskybacteria bacterium]